MDFYIDALKVSFFKSTAAKAMILLIRSLVANHRIYANKVKATQIPIDENKPFKSASNAAVIIGS